MADSVIGTPIDWQMQPGPCVVCGKVDYPLSMGGPGVCPSCDCGNFGVTQVERQGKEIIALRADLEAVAVALNILIDNSGDWWGDDSEADRAYTRAEEALARPGVQAVLGKVGGTL